MVRLTTAHVAALGKIAEMDISPTAPHGICRKTFATLAGCGLIKPRFQKGSNASRYELTTKGRALLGKRPIANDGE